MYPRCSASKTTIDIFVIVVFHPHGMIFFSRTRYWYYMLLFDLLSRTLVMKFSESTVTYRKFILLAS